MRTMIRIAVVAVLLFAAVGAFAQNGDTLNIGGQVPLTLDLTVTADANADNLTLLAGGTDATTTAPIATIDITTNNTAGWELWLFSANADGVNAGIENADGDRITYTVTYAGAGGVATTNLTSAGLAVGESAANVDQAAQLLSITYLQSDAHNAGYYSDQLAIVLRAK